MDYLEQVPGDWRAAVAQATDVRDQDGRLLPPGTPLAPSTLPDPAGRPPLTEEGPNRAVPRPQEGQEGPGGTQPGRDTPGPEDSA